MRNWAGNYTYEAARVHFPGSVQEIQDIVKRCRNVRALGTRHSFNGIGDCPEADVISLKRLDRLLRFDRVGKAEWTATIEGGITYGQLCPQLDREGFALPNLASLPHISVAGACATATHGSGDRNQNLAMAVVGMKLVEAGGEEVSYSRAEHGERFAGMVVSLGGLGVVTELTLKLGPRYAIRQTVYLNLPLGRLREHFDAIMSRAYSVSLFTDWQRPRFNQVWLKHRVGDGEPVGCDPDFFDATPATVRLHPSVHRLSESCTEQLGIPGPWHERLPHFRMEFTPSTGVELQSEYLVPRARTLDAIEAVYSLRGAIAPLLQMSEVRTIAADDLWMSPCYKQACVALHFTWERNWPAVRALLPEIEKELTPLGGRPHWGKLFTVPGAVLRTLYGEQLTRFRGLLEDKDGSGKFRNPFLQQCIFA
jgi:xylitol oxidase